MIVVDMESSGLHPYKNSLVSVGALDMDAPSNQFYMECRVWEGAHIEDEALAINGFSREAVTDPKKPSDKELVIAFLEWVKTCKEHTIAGQNPSADRDFLKATAERYHLDWPLAYRIVDLHSIAYFHMARRDVLPPMVKHHSDINLDKILVYVGLSERPGVHNGLTDAKLEAEALSRLFKGQNLLPEYASMPIPPYLQEKV